MPNWGENFIKLYTNEEKESLESLVNTIFLKFMLIQLEKDLLATVCRTWWMVIGSFGNTALFDMVQNDRELTQAICREANIDHDTYISAIDGLVRNNVAELASDPEEFEKYTLFLLFDLIGIFEYITDTSPKDHLFSEHPDPELLNRFYKKAASIMDKGSDTWKNTLMSLWDNAIKSL